MKHVKLVSLSDPVDIRPSPEARLRQLFEAEDELLAELALVRSEQRMTRNEYASAHGLLLRPSVDGLRKVLL